MYISISYVYSYASYTRGAIISGPKCYRNKFTFISQIYIKPM